MKTSIRPEDPSNATALAAPATGTVAIPEGYDPNQYDDTSRDIEVPTISLVGNIGPLAKKFKNSAGRFALGDLLLGDAVNVIPVALVKFFTETHRDGKEIKYGSPESQTRKVFATAADAAKQGYFVDFDDKTKNRVQEAARIGFLVIAPEGDQSGEFVEKVGELKLARAKCTYQRGSYRGTFRPIFNHANKLALANGIKTDGLNVTQLFAAAKPWTHLWALTPEEVTGRENAWWETRASKVAPLAPEVIAWITENYGDGRI